MLEFRVLGPVEARAHGKPLPLGSPKQKTFLAVLLSAAGAAVSLDQFVEELWCGNPPKSALANLRNYAANLRRVLPDTERCRLESGISSYSLAVPSDGLDIDVFERLVAQGRSALVHGDGSAAAARLELAMAIWRGEPLEGAADGPRLSALVRRLDEQKIAAQEDLFEALLMTSLSSNVLGRIRDWTIRYPLRERGWYLLMQALVSTGDVAGALAAFRDMREILVRELGIEPGEQVTQLHHAILNRQVAVPVAERVVPSEPAVATLVVPRQLPPGPMRLVGRQDTLAHLRRRLTATAAPVVSGCPTVVVIRGAAGTGKSALALRAAHEVAEHFDDGQLYVDLRQVSVAGALSLMSRALGGRNTAQPMDLPELTALFRSLTAGKRLLVVLDNATETDDLAPLVPASSGCAVMVTAGGRPIGVWPTLEITATTLTRAESLELLCAELGTGDNPVAERVAALCGGLPLALHAAASCMREEPGMSVASIACRVAGQGQANGSGRLVHHW